MVGVVHAETSTGVLTDLTEVIALAHEHDALVVADCVTSLGSHQVQVDDWDIDVCYSASQKCLGSPPGLAPISMGPGPCRWWSSGNRRCRASTST